MKNRLKIAAYLLLLSFGLMVVGMSCEKEIETMTLPPAESLVIDWSAFPNNGTKSAEEAELTKVNWFNSAATIFVWNTVVAANMAIPTVAYAAAFNNAPVYLGDNTWEWSYSVTHKERTFIAQLTGARIDKNTFSMEMVLSEAGGFGEFKWFEGVIRYDRTEANWILRRSPDKPDDYLEIAYDKSLETGIKNIRYTVIDPQDSLYNGYVEFGIDPELDLDAHYTISGGDNTTQIEWSTLNKMGRVMSQDLFGDANWHCWDSELNDVDCRVAE
ncbi:MAG: hypothetical protein WD577_01005 [Bacteroidales bacterium]